LKHNLRLDWRSSTIIAIDPCYFCGNHRALRITDEHVVTNFVFYHRSHVKFVRVSLTAYLLK